jgi:hypothetical protein
MRFGEGKMALEFDRYWICTFMMLLLFPSTIQKVFELIIAIPSSRPTAPVGKAY